MTLEVTGRMRRKPKVMRIKPGLDLKANHFVWLPPKPRDDPRVVRRFHALDGAPENARSYWSIPVVRDAAVAEAIRTGPTPHPVWVWDGNEDAPCIQPSVATNIGRGGVPLSHGYLGGADRQAPGVWVPHGDVPGEVIVRYTRQAYPMEGQAMKAIVVSEVQGALQDAQGSQLPTVQTLAARTKLSRPAGTSGQVLILNSGDADIGIVLAMVKPGEFVKLPDSAQQFEVLED